MPMWSFQDGHSRLVRPIWSEHYNQESFRFKCFGRGCWYEGRKGTLRSLLWKTQSARISQQGSVSNVQSEAFSTNYPITPFRASSMISSIVRPCSDRISAVCSPTSGECLRWVSGVPLNRAGALGSTILPPLG